MTWKQSQLHEIAECIGRGKSPVYDEESIHPVLNQACIQHGKLDLSRLKFITEAHSESLSAAKRTQRGDILVNSTGTGTLGRVGYWDEDTSIAFDGHVTLVRLKPEYDSRFFYYWLHMPSAQSQIQNDCISGSTNQVELSREAFRRIEVRYPPDKLEQAQIAEILATIDRAVEQIEALIAKYQRIKASLMQDLITRGIDDNGNLRDPTTHKFQLSPLGSIPQSWEVPVLAEHLVCIEQGWSPECEDDPATNGEWGVLRTTAVVWEGFDCRENKRLPQDLRPRPHLEIRPGDVLMTRAGPNSRVGVVAYVNTTQPKMILSDKIYRLYPKPSIESQFLSLALSSNLYQRQLSRAKTGMAESQTNISQAIVRSLRIPLPQEDEQKKIVVVWQRMLEMQQDQSAILQKLQRIRSGLLHDLLTGQVSVAPLFGTI